MSMRCSYEAIRSRGLEIATFQAELFAASLIRAKTSSPVFLRWFLLSDFAYKMGCTPVELQAFAIPEAFFSIENEVGPSECGKTKYSPEAFHWLGHFTRYVCYNREIPNRLFYRLFGVKKIYSLYEAYHAQSEEWCLVHLLENDGYTEADLNLSKRLKGIINRGYQRANGCFAGAFLLRLVLPFFAVSGKIEPSYQDKRRNEFDVRADGNNRSGH